MPIADELQRRWYAPDLAPLWWTRPLARVYGLAGALRRGAYRHGMLRAVRLPVPVVVVGNLVAGGAGKTPLTIALVEALQARGLRPGVVSRGYGGSATVAQLLDGTPDPALVGDEPTLIHARTGVPVAVGARRVRAARLLLEADVDVVLADDGLQHYALARDLEICVVDGVRRFGNGRLLPAGPLREPIARLRCVDFVVCNGGTPARGEVPMQLAAVGAVALADPARSCALAAFAGQRVNAVAGIGNPARFFESLRAAGIQPVERPFPDHHRYRAGDLDFRDGLPVLMTGKDAVKCRGFAKPDWWGVPVSAVLPSVFLDEVANRIAEIHSPPSGRLCPNGAGDGPSPRSDPRSSDAYPHACPSPEGRGA
ncbi:MAG TPA: tetraacyldisaccharide 4'-kinase [Rhodanobacteraceae bacterium]